MLQVLCGALQEDGFGAAVGPPAVGPPALAATVGVAVGSLVVGVAVGTFVGVAGLAVILQSLRAPSQMAEPVCRFEPYPGAL